MRLESTFTIAVAFGLALPATLAAQQPTGAAARPAVKGIWEPVNYPEDLQLNGVFFITPEIGWVAGNAGTILHTRDGGATWAAQLGGDPTASDPAVQWIRFIDENHGWAIQHYGILLHTTDGETWERIGSEAYGELTFISPTTGFRVYGGKIYRTRDAGRTWQEVVTCRAKMQVAGLARDVNCDLASLYFPSATVGYAVGGPRITAKTVDGGDHWSVLVGPEEPGDQRAHEVLFVDESTGFQRRWGALYRTTDGGTTWSGVVASGGFGPVRFADPEVGWSYYSGSSTLSDVLTYTSDGGKRWTTREADFPAVVHGLSVPRRDRAYVVGDHGMVYRYRLVPPAEPVPATALAGPAMPPFESPLDDGVETVSEQLDALEGQIEAAAEGEAVDTTEAPDTTEAFVEACCVESVNELQAAVDAVTPLVPPFLAKYRNVNLVIAGLQLVGVLPDQLSQVKAALQSLRKAQGPAAAAAALVALTAAVDSLRARTRQAFQQQPMQVESGAAPEGPGGGTEASAASTVSGGSAAGNDSGAAPAVPQKAAAEAKKQLDKMKKKIKVRIP